MYEGVIQLWSSKLNASDYIFIFAKKQTNKQQQKNK